MGAQASVARVNSETQLINKVKQQGANISCQNVISDTEFVIGGGDFKLNQACEITYDQALNATADILQEALRNVSAETKAGLGIAVSGAELSSKDIIKHFTEQECGTANVSNLIKGSKFIVQPGAKTVEIRQTGDIDMTCSMEALYKAIQKKDEMVSAEAKGTSLAEIIFGPIGQIVGAILAVLVLVFLGRRLLSDDKKEKNKEHQSGGLLRNFSLLKPVY